MPQDRKGKVRVTTQKMILALENMSPRKDFPDSIRKQQIQKHTLKVTEDDLKTS